VEIVLASAVVAGHAGAAVWSASATPLTEVAAGFGEDDGLTRYVLAAASRPLRDDALGASDAVPGVAGARTSTAPALVAVDAVTPERLQ